MAETSKKIGCDKKVHLGFVHSYHLPKYIRSTTLKAALESNPNLVIENAANENYRVIRYYQTLKKIIRILRQKKTWLWLVNFRGHEIYWPLRWLANKKAIIVFDELISPYDAWTNERKTFKKESLLMKIVYKIEKAILHDANYLMTDSNSQASYYSDLFKVPIEKFTVIRGSANEAMFTPEAPPKKFDITESFLIFTYGYFIPLQGMELILPVAEQLRDLPIRFLVGGGMGKTLAEFLATKEDRNLTNITHQPWINFPELPSYIRGASLCLGGPFGYSPQVKRVITGKALQFLACESPTIIGLTDETRDIFEDKKNCLLVEPGNPGALTEAISWAYHNQDKLPEIARQGRLTYEKYYSMDVLKQTLNKFVDSISVDQENEA